MVTFIFVFMFLETLNDSSSLMTYTDQPTLAWNKDILHLDSEIMSHELISETAVLKYCNY
jgi:hypothetical protein